MTTLLLMIGMVILTASMIPYIREVRRAVVRPRIVSWSVWAVLLATMTIVAVQAGEGISAMLTGVTAVECAIVVALAWRSGYRTFHMVDIMALIGAVIGFGVLILTNDPLIALAIMVGVDGLAYLPTLKHALEEPFEESLLSYALGLLGNSLCLIATLMHGPTATGTIYPIYSVVASSLVVGILIYSRSTQRANDTYEYAGNE